MPGRGQAGAGGADAGALERQTVPGAARLDPTTPPANVVPLPTNVVRLHPEPAA